MAAQKTLLQQVQDLENESREMADFMAEEKNALAECLREAEAEVGDSSSILLYETNKKLNIKGERMLAVS